MRNPKNLIEDEENGTLSKLPSYMVDKIIWHYLPFNESVKTSLISSAWRFRWMYNPKLIFDAQFRQTIRGNHKLETVIYCVLSRLRGQIKKFYFNIDDYQSSPHISHWTHLLLLGQHKVNDFTIGLSYGLEHIIPQCFFKFGHLKHLNLRRCVFNPPQEFPGFIKLATIEFERVQFDSEVFLNFISSCKLLEKIRLSGCSDLDYAEVEGPNLKNFIFHGIVKSIRFKNCPVLAEVSLSINIAFGFSGYKYFEFVPTLERLRLYGGVSEYISALGSKDRLPRGLDRLKFLDLSLSLNGVAEVEFALGLLRASKNLQKLRVPLFRRRRDQYAPVLGFMQARLSSKDLRLKKLRRVELVRFSFTDPQMVFARLILASAEALEEMVIFPEFSFADRSVSKIPELERASRASRDARIVLAPL